MKRLVVLMLGVIAALAPVSAQDASRVSLPRTESRDFTSKINGREYSVWVYKPPTYAQDPNARFPVIYLTDGNLVFGVAAQTHNLLRSGNTVPPALIVAVSRTGVDEDTRPGNSFLAERTLDLTPTRVVSQEQKSSAQYQRDVRSGGAADFLRVMREEVIADIEQRYRTNGDRTFLGYSLGGLFGAYVLFHQPDTFQRMILVSPSLWWHANVTSKYEESFASAHKSLPVRLFISAGEDEPASTMLAPVRNLDAKLRSRNYEGLILTTRTFANEDHFSTFPLAVTRGLRTVFGDPTLK
jgi:predicted alpha/beta superfamily hydrolase